MIKEGVGIDTLLNNTSMKPMFAPNEKERTFISGVYNDFIFDLSIKGQTWEVLGWRSLEQFWAQSNRDYNVIVEEDPNDPVTQYVSGVSRDKANTFISNLTSQLMAPSVTALNTSKEVDIVVSKLGRPILEWQHSNDGRPAESGELKNFRYTHKQVVEGTTHIQDDIDPDTGKLCSQGIPNEEVFIPNFYQPNVQLQGHFLRVQMDTSYQEAKAEFGDLPNFEYVMPGTLGWMNQTFEFKERYKAVVSQNKVTIVRAWYPVSDKDLKTLKAQGKVKKYVTKAKWYNIIINGVNMFPPDNLMPYEHGFYPISKGIFESFSPVEFYWGNSMPNKARFDKKFLDGWKTLIRYKAKLAAIPPGFNTSGQALDANIYIPGNITDLPAGTDVSKVFQVPQGMAQGITTGDIAILRDTNEDLDRETAAPQTSGQQSPGKQTARESIIIEQNAQKAMAGITQQVAFLQEARAFPILKASFQFLTRQEIAKLSIPDQSFDDGQTGTFEILFKKLPKMTPEQELEASYEIADRQGESKLRGKGTKQISEIDIDYILNLDFYCKANAESILKDNSALREAKAQVKWETYSSNPIFNIKKAARKLVREMGDSDDMVVDQEPMQPGTPGPEAPTPGGNVLNPMLSKQTANLLT